MTDWIGIAIIAAIALGCEAHAWRNSERLGKLRTENAELRKELAEFHASGLKRGKNGQFKRP